MIPLNSTSSITIGPLILALMICVSVRLAAQSVPPSLDISPARSRADTTGQPCTADSGSARILTNVPAVILQRIARSAIDLGPDGSAGPVDAVRLGVSDNPDDEYWDDRFTPEELPAGTSDEVFALAADDRDLFAGGSFENVVGIPAHGLARWDGEDWTAIDDGTRVGIDGTVFALALDGNDLYVGGQFSSAGGLPARNIAVWNRTTRRWRTVGDVVSASGAVSFISAIELHDGQVYVGGHFERAGSTSVRNIARWDGTEWHPLGSSVEGNVTDIEEFKGNLYVGGSFGRAGNVSTSGIAYWDGSDWHGMRGGINGVVNTLSAGNDVLFIGGRFSHVFCFNPPRCDTSTTIVNIVGWIPGDDDSDGTYTMVVGPDATTVDVREIVAVGNSGYVGGSFFFRPRGTGVPPMIKNVGGFGGGWGNFETGVDAPVNALALFRGGLVAGGAFKSAGEVRADHIAIWPRSIKRWRPMVSGFTLGLVSALTSHRGTIYASGPFRYKADPKQILVDDNHLARLGAHGWHVEKGIIKGNAVTVASTDEEIYVGGAFDRVDSLLCRNICRWDPDTKVWSALTPGSGVTSRDRLSFVSAIAPDGDDIYIGGSFGIVHTSIDTFETPNVALFNRATGVWSALGEGLDNHVWALLVTPDGTLYAGGDFRFSGSRPIRYVARWDGTAWQRLGDGIDGTVRSLAWGNGRLYAGGTFSIAGTITTDNIAMWDPVGEEWSALGEGLTSDFLPSVDALAFTQGKLFAGGFFRHSGSIEARNIARWDGEGWEPLGSGADHVVYAMVAQEKDLYIAGTFRTAGRKSSRNVALWHDPTLTIAPIAPTAIGSSLLAGPNPFADRTIVSYTVPRRAPVRIGIHDLRGVEIARLVDRVVDAGEYRVTWDAVDALPQGVYVCRMDYEGTVTTRKIVRR